MSRSIEDELADLHPRSVDARLAEEQYKQHLREVGKAHAKVMGEANRPLPGPARCTGYIDDHGRIAHDGPTCPLHEGSLDYNLIRRGLR